MERTDALGRTALAPPIPTRVRVAEEAVISRPPMVPLVVTVALGPGVAEAVWPTMASRRALAVRAAMVLSTSL